MTLRGAIEYLCMTIRNEHDQGELDDSEPDYADLRRALKCVETVYVIK